MGFGPGDMRSTDFQTTECKRPLYGLKHFVLITILSISGLATMGPHVHAQSLTLEKIVTSVDLASDTPNIDAAVVTLNSLWTLPKNSKLAEPGGQSESTKPSRFHAASISKLFTAMTTWSR